MVRGSWVGRRSTIDDTVSDRVQPLRVRPVPEAPARRTGSTSRDTCRHGSARLRRTRHSPCSSGACAWGSHPVRRATACQSPDPPSRPRPLTCPRHAANRPAEQRYDLPSNGASARTGPTGRPPVRSCQEAGTPRNGWAPHPTLCVPRSDSRLRTRRPRLVGGVIPADALGIHCLLHAWRALTRPAPPRNAGRPSRRRARRVQAPSGALRARGSEVASVGAGLYVGHVDADHVLRRPGAAHFFRRGHTDGDLHALTGPVRGARPPASR